jgi:hypothetical protein
MINQQTSTTDSFKIIFTLPPSPTAAGATQEVVAQSGSPYYVSLHMEKDFFTCADRATIIIENSNPATYVQYMNRKTNVAIYINGNLNMVGYVFDFKYEYGRNTTKLTVEVKDLLEFMAQGSCPPNMVPGVNLNSTTNYHFPKDTTYKQAFEVICATFQHSFAVDFVPEVVLTDQPTTKNGKPNNPTNLTISSGGFAGIRAGGKKSKQFTKSVNSSLNRLNTPEKGESYLSYLKRLAKMIGCYVKMVPGSEDQIVIQAPTYDRNTGVPFNIYHYVSVPNNQQNNVEEHAELHWNYDGLHSVIIVEGNSLDPNEFHFQDDKAYAINELTGYSLESLGTYNFNLATQSQELPPAVPGVRQLIDQLVDLSNTSISVSNGQVSKSGSNYASVPFNAQLYGLRYKMPVDTMNPVSLPLYDVSHSAHTMENLLFEAAQKLAEEQDKAVEFVYKTDGFTQNGFVWQPNMLVNVVEEALTPGTPMNITMWIKKVNYMQDRHGGTTTTITCTLPYTHNFELVDVPANVQPAYDNSSIIPLSGMLNFVPTASPKPVTTPTPANPFPNLHLPNLNSSG